MTFMKIFGNRSGIPAAAAVLCVVFAAHGAQAARPMPTTEYTCHVTSVEGKVGIAFIQANSERQARASIVKARAFVGPSSFGDVATVEQCVERGKGRLRSEAARKLLGSLVM